jgi:hypothetical protein
LQVDIKTLEKILYLAEICLAGLKNGFELTHQFVEQSVDVVVGAVDAVGTAAYSKRLKSGVGFLGI